MLSFQGQRNMCIRGKTANASVVTSAQAMHLQRSSTRRALTSLWAERQRRGDKPEKSTNLIYLVIGSFSLRKTLLRRNSSFGTDSAFWPSSGRSNNRSASHVKGTTLVFLRVGKKCLMPIPLIGVIRLLQQRLDKSKAESC